jgi:hypothetical protein
VTDVTAACMRRPKWTRVVTAYPARIAGPRVGTNALGHRLLLFVAAGTLLAGCAAGGRPFDQELARDGYWYHDANHEDGGGAQASPQAIYNATHGTWLWPPAQTDIPD